MAFEYIMGVSISKSFDFGFWEIIISTSDCTSCRGKGFPLLCVRAVLCSVCTMAMSFGLSTADNRPELMEEVKI